MTTRSLIDRVASFLAFAALVVVPLEEGLAEPAILTLDSMSFISFDDEVIAPLPAGSTIQFDLGTTGHDGTTPFLIPPQGLKLGPVSISQLGSSVQYTLTSATGCPCLTRLPTMDMVSSG